MSYFHYRIQQIRQFGIRKSCSKLINRFADFLRNKQKRKNTLRFDSRKTTIFSTLGSPLISTNPQFDELNSPEIYQWLNLHLAHRFDLLGSGWVENQYSTNAIGLEGHQFAMNIDVKDFDEAGNWLASILPSAYLTHSQSLWQKIEGDYQPIDWQKDFKSGYRWSQHQWYKDCGKNLPRGVDVKVPWELARLQHLPRIALLAEGNPEKKTELIRECKNQIYDFLATNPPGLGVNWNCTMDVAIRAVNLVATLDLLLLNRDHNKADRTFEAILSQSLYEHGLHIVRNLEYYEGLRGNHYLANVCGLLFIATRLARTKETDSWLAFAVQELIAECEYQFLEDGTNFEASTCYHKLSLEMLIYSTALVMGFSEDKRVALVEYGENKDLPRLKPLLKQHFKIEKNIFPDWYFRRLRLAIAYLEALKKPDGTIPQIGDNDSGCFLKLGFTGVLLSSQKAHQLYAHLPKIIPNLFPDEDLLQVGNLIAAGLTLFTPDRQKNSSPESEVVKLFSSNKQYDSAILTTPVIHSFCEVNVDFPFSLTKIFEQETEGNSLQEAGNWYSFAGSGLYIYQSERVHLTISAGDNGQKGLGGHAHNDKLAITLTMDGIDRLTDPGTYLYTPLPEKRNVFRSAVVHNVPFIEGIEQNPINLEPISLFTLKQVTCCQMVKQSAHFVSILLQYENIQILRSITINEENVEIHDQSTHPFQQNWNTGDLFSPAYGKLFHPPS